MKVKGQDRYLYRAIDSNGNTLDMWLRNHRDTVYTKAFIKRLLRDYGQPRSIVTDKYAPSLKAIKELKEDGYLDKKVKHWKSKYLNNILEQDHRQVKGKLPHGMKLKIYLKFHEQISKNWLSLLFVQTLQHNL